MVLGPRRTHRLPYKAARGTESLRALQSFCSICLRIKVQIHPVPWDWQAKGHLGERWARCCVLGTVFRFLFLLVPTCSGSRKGLPLHRRNSSRGIQSDCIVGSQHSREMHPRVTKPQLQQTLRDWPLQTQKVSAMFSDGCSSVSALTCPLRWTLLVSHPLPLSPPTLLPVLYQLASYPVL